MASDVFSKVTLLRKEDAATIGGLSYTRGLPSRIHLLVESVMTPRFIPTLSLLTIACSLHTPFLVGQDGISSHAEIVLRDQPVAYWDFSDPESSKSIASKVKTELKANLFGKLALGQQGPRPKAFPRFAPNNTAAEFPGGKNCLQVNDPGEQSPLDFDIGDSISLEAWVFPSAIGNDQHMSIISKGRTGNKDFEPENLNYALRLKGDGKVALLNFLFRSRSDQVESADAEKKKVAAKFHRWTSAMGFPVDSGWHHVAITYSFGTKGSLRAYIDGQAVEGEWDMEGDTVLPPFVDNDQLWIGSGQPNHTAAFKGWLDEVALYRKVLSAQQIADRYRCDATPTDTWIAAQDLPDDRVVVRLFDGLMDRTWGFSLDKPALEFELPFMAMTQLPKKYSERGVIEDRPLPVLTQSYVKRTLAAGKYSILLRSKNATRLWIDGKQIASQQFLTTNGDGHEAVPVLPDPPRPNLIPISQGHRENVIELDLEAGTHVFRLDAIAGGRSIRPETGNLCVAIASDDGDFQILTPDTADPWVPTERGWREFLAEEDGRFQDLNQRLRLQAGAQEQKYWQERHRVAREIVLAKANKESRSRTIDQLCLASSGRDRDAISEIDDAAFLRRITLDTIGVVPTRNELVAFLADPSPKKRADKIDQLLADDRWADHWVGYWQDVLAENPGIVKPEQNNTGPFRYWIHESFLDNKPMDRFATELSLMEGSKYYGGLGGFAMASQNDAPMAAKAQILTKAFLGMEMSCARCHDSPNSPFKQEELFSLAAMLQREPLSLPVSSTVPLNPDGRKPLITISLKAGDKLTPDWHLASFPKVELPANVVRNEQDPRERFAAIITSPTNSRFARVMMNRLWHRYMGWGMVEPVDNWDASETLDPKLLDCLEQAFVVSGYDLKAAARLIFNSQVYQASPLSKKELDTIKEAKQLAYGPARRRLSAEQVIDSLYFVAGKPLDVEPMSLDPEGRRPPEQFLHLGFPTRAWQFASTSTDRDRPALMLPAVQQVCDLMVALGWRDSRPTPQTLRDESASPLQSLILGNGLSATRLARLSEGSQFTELAWTAKSVTELVDRLYETVLSRPATLSERDLFVSLLEPGFESRKLNRYATVKAVGSNKRNAVSWANHLVPEATRIKLLLEQEVLQGDMPTLSLEADWRERMEDASWALLNSPEFLFVP